MSELYKTRYQNLFQVHILHHYWLDNGVVLFDSMPTDITVANFNGRPLRGYDVRKFLSIEPSATTAHILTNIGAVFKTTALGFIVAIPSDVVLPLNTHFEFVLLVSAASFYDYTALTLQTQKIYELYHATEKRSYRYKENVMVLSNFTGTARTTGLTQSLYLSSPIPVLTSNDKAEAIFVTADGFLKQLNGDMPSTIIPITNSQASDLPVFAHQGDVPEIIPPSGLLGVPPRGIALNDDIPDTAFALIRLYAVRPSDDAFSFVNNQGKAKSEAPLYQVRFKNRTTLWRYFDRTNRTLKEEQGPFPLTYFGNASSKQKPLAAPKVQKSGNKVVRLESEIFI
jgi:hypothetical protein